MSVFLNTIFQHSKTWAKLAIAVAFAGFSAVSHSETALHFVSVSTDQKSRTPTTSVFIGDGVVRIDDASEPAIYTLFDTSSRLITVVDRREKSYLVMNDEILGLIEQQLQLMRQQVAKMPKEQREQFEKVMGTGLKDAPPMSIEKTNDSSTVADVPCTIQLIHSGSDLLHRYCTANAEALAITSQEYADVTAMFAALQSLAQRTGANNAMVPFAPERLGGLPIRMHNLESQFRPVQELDKISRKPLAVEVFRVPEGYKQEQP